MSSNQPRQPRENNLGRNIFIGIILIAIILAAFPSLLVIPGTTSDLDTEQVPNSNTDGRAPRLPTTDSFEEVLTGGTIYDVAELVHPTTSSVAYDGRGGGIDLSQTYFDARTVARIAHADFWGRLNIYPPESKSSGTIRFSIRQIAETSSNARISVLSAERSTLVSMLIRDGFSVGSTLTATGGINANAVLFGSDNKYTKLFHVEFIYSNGGYTLNVEHNGAIESTTGLFNAFATAETDAIGWLAFYGQFYMTPIQFI